MISITPRASEATGCLAVIFLNVQQDNETTKEHYFQCVSQCRAVWANIRVHRLSENLLASSRQYHHL